MVFERSHYPSWRIDKPASGALSDIGSWGKANRRNFLSSRAHSALKNSTAQVSGTAPRKERVSSPNVLPEVRIAPTHFRKPPLGIGKTHSGTHRSISWRRIIDLYTINWKTF